MTVDSRIGEVIINEGANQGQRQLWKASRVASVRGIDDLERSW